MVRLTDEEMIFVKELQKFSLCREQNSFESGVWKNSFRELPHSSVHPAVVEHKYYAGSVRAALERECRTTYSLRPSLGNEI